MRKRLIGGLALAVCLGLAVLPGRAQGPAPTGDDLTTSGITDPYYRAWAGRSAAYRIAQQKQLQAEKEAREREAKATAALGGVPGGPPPSLKSLEEERAKEQNAYFRRIEVCDRLMQIALQTNDSALLRQVEDLEKQAFDLYQKRTGVAAAKLPASSADPDAKALDAKLGPKSSETGVILPKDPPAGKSPTTVATRTEGKR